MSFAKHRLHVIIIGDKIVAVNIVLYRQSPVADTIVDNSAYLVVCSEHSIP